MKRIKVPSEVFKKVCDELADFDSVISHKFGACTKMEYFTLDGVFIGVMFVEEDDTEYYVCEKYLLWEEN